MEAKILKTFCTSALVILISFSVSCREQGLKKIYEGALVYEENKNFEKAFKEYVKVFKRKPNTELAIQSALKAGNIAYLELKKYAEALTLFSYVVVHSQKKEEVYLSQNNIAQINFENLRNYNKAIKVYFSLLKVYKEDSRKKKWRRRIVKAYFSLNNFFQALLELKILLKENLSKTEFYEIKNIEANIYMATKEPSKAIEIYKKLIKDYPKEKENKSLYVNMAICYEDLTQLKEAVETLKIVKKFYPEPEFIDIMLRRLNKRIKNQPGVKGRLR